MNNLAIVREGFYIKPRSNTFFALGFNDGVNALKSNKWSTLYLTHDLNSFDEDGHPRTGLNILYFLIENPEHLPNEIVLIGVIPQDDYKIMDYFIDRLYSARYWHFSSRTIPAFSATLIKRGDKYEIRYGTNPIETDSLKNALMTLKSMRLKRTK